MQLNHSEQALGAELTTEFLEALEERAVEFAWGAGGLLHRHFAAGVKAESKSKTHYDPVTEADRESEAYLREQIHAAYPEHSILGEEGDDLVGTSDFLWVLDPLDGTANFVNRLPFFAVSVGVLHQGQPVAAAIYTPTSELLTESVFHAHLGGQTMLSPQARLRRGASGDRVASGDNEVPVKVADSPQPEPAHLSGLPGNYWRSIRFSGDVRRSPGEVRTLGSIALELSMTACGTLQYAIFNSPKIWDVAAGVLLVQQAGGLPLVRHGGNGVWSPFHRFEPRSGEPKGLDAYRKWSGTIIVGNPEMAWAVANNFHRPVQLARKVGSFVSKVRQQLPLFGGNGMRKPSGPAKDETAPSPERDANAGSMGNRSP